MMKPILTERMSLPSLQAGDAAFLLTLINTPSWIQYIGDRQVHTLEAAEVYLRNGAMQHEQDHGFGMRKMMHTETHELLGICGLVRREGLPLPDLGFALLPEYEGYGYAFEAARSVLTEDTRTWMMTEISAITTPENDRSIALLHRLGFVQDGEVQLPGQEEILHYFHLVIST
ncbi:MAG: GNAT family N-acetyltransferase [Saprospiraceae bacterium]|nr:GNAT family N-acetyltransferase [Saprospiraceae bacterium]